MSVRSVPITSCRGGFDDILGVEFRDRIADLARELGLKVCCERHVDGKWNSSRLGKIHRRSATDTKDLKAIPWNIKNRHTRSACEGTKWHEDQSGKNQNNIHRTRLTNRTSVWLLRRTPGLTRPRQS